MEAMGFTKSAKLAKRWFGTSKFIGPTHGEELKGTRFPKDRVDTDTVTLSWLLSYKKIKAAFERLYQENIATDAVIKDFKSKDGKIGKYLAQQTPVISGSIDTWKICKQDLQELHHQFQFQFEKVSDLSTLQWGQPTDVTGSIGSFGFYAAVAHALIQEKAYDTAHKTRCVQHTITITHIYVYAKDAYTFLDDPKKQSSQYLGHWNKTGLVVLPAVAAANKIAGIDIGNEPFSNSGTADLNGNRNEKDLYYSVRNSTFNEWREKHNQGGDFIIYSDLKKIKLDKPIVVTMGEICTPI
jgi:Family of unknown function (DUF6402)